jgi:hypothetical protein
MTTLQSTATPKALNSTAQGNAALHEFRRLLKIYEAVYDERYVWD